LGLLVGNKHGGILRIDVLHMSDVFHFFELLFSSGLEQSRGSIS
jgi:hypothetical protein